MFSSPFCNLSRRISHQETASLHQQQEDPTDLSHRKAAVSHTSREQGRGKNPSPFFALMFAALMALRREASPGHSITNHHQRGSVNIQVSSCFSCYMIALERKINSNFKKENTIFIIARSLYGLKKEKALACRFTSCNFVSCFKTCLL